MMTYEAATQLELIDHKKAMALWRRVLVQLIVDYFEDYPRAENNLMGVHLDCLCEIVGFDTDSTRSAIIAAKQEMTARGLTYKAWLAARFDTQVRPKRATRKRERSFRGGSLMPLMRYERLRTICPEIAERIKRENDRRAHQTNQRKRVLDRDRKHKTLRIEEFFRQLWGKSGGAE